MSAQPPQRPPLARELAQREVRIRETFAALGAAAYDRLVSGLTPDVVLGDPLAGELPGSAAVKSWIQTRARLFPRAAFEPVQILFDGQTGAVEWRARFRRFDGQEFALSGAAIVEFSGDRIARLMLYYDGGCLKDAPDSRAGGQAALSR
jgi:ketosteroid isomerase-like protein